MDGWYFSDPRDFPNPDFIPRGSIDLEATVRIWSLEALLDTALFHKLGALRKG